MEHFRWQLTTSGSGRIVSAIPAWCVYESTGFHLGNIGFNPYSGVKTSILVLDRVLARKTGHIAFFKMDNDGFDLGAQRRPTDRNDLPQVQAELGDYLRRLRSGEPLDDFQPTLGLVVKKARVAEGGEYNLSGDRYRENNMEDEITGNTGAAFASINKGQIESIKIPLPPLELQRGIVNEIVAYQRVIDGARAVVENYRPHIAVDPEWPTYSLGDLAENLDSRRVPVSKEHRKSGPFPYYGASGVVDYVDGYIFDEDVLLISEDGANLLARSTPIAFSVSGRSWVNNHAHVLRFRTMDTQKCVEYYLNSVSLREYVTGSAQPKLNQQALSRIQIPLPDDRAILQGLISELKAEQVIIEANRELIGRFEKKIHATINQVWG